MNAPTPKNWLLVATAIGFLGVIVASASFASISPNLTSNSATAESDFVGQLPAYILNAPYDILSGEFE